MTAKKTKPVAAKKPAPNPKSAPKKVAPAKAVKKPVKKAPAKKRKSRTGAAYNKSVETACQEFVLNGGDQSKAYRKAFPASMKWKDKTVWNRASEMFAIREVAGRVKELQEEAAKIAKETFDVDAKYVLGRLVEIDQMDFADILNDDGSLKFVRDWPKTWRTLISGFDITEMYRSKDDDSAAVSILKKIKWPDKIRNLELLGKCASVQAFNENYVHTGPGGGPIETVTRIELVAATGNGH